MTNWKQHPLANLVLWFFILGDGGGGGGLPCILMFWYNVREREREVHAQADPFNFISGVIFGSNVIYFEYRANLLPIMIQNIACQLL